MVFCGNNVDVLWCWKQSGATTADPCGMTNKRTGTATAKGNGTNKCNDKKTAGCFRLRGSQSVGCHAGLDAGRLQDGKGGGLYFWTKSAAKDGWEEVGVRSEEKEPVS